MSPVVILMTWAALRATLSGGSRRLDVLGMLSVKHTPIPGKDFQPIIAIMGMTAGIQTTILARPLQCGLTAPAILCPRWRKGHVNGDEVVSSSCVKCGQLVRLHLRPGSNQPADTEPQLWPCPWCRQLNEAPLPGKLQSANRRPPH
jgi:hypothetical protein